MSYEDDQLIALIERQARMIEVVEHAIDTLKIQIEINAQSLGIFYKRLQAAEEALKRLQSTEQQPTKTTG